MAASRRNESSTWSLPLMVLSFVVIGGFLFYLNQASRASVVEVVEEEVPAASSGAQTVDWAAFVAAPESFQGQRLRIAGLEVVSRVGNAAFWVEAPGDTYYLVRMLPEVLAQGVEIGPGAVVTVEGATHAMGDSVLNAWEQDGVITSGQRAEAEFATSFLEVASVERP
jgi:hypothetical protein